MFILNIIYTNTGVYQIYLFTHSQKEVVNCTAAPGRAVLAVGRCFKAETAKMGGYVVFVFIVTISKPPYLPDKRILV